MHPTPQHQSPKSEDEQFLTAFLDPSTIEADPILRKLQDLEAQIRLLRHDITTEANHQPTDASIQFLLAEFTHLGEFWRHTDARMESGLSLYFTATGIILSALIFFREDVADFQTFIASTILIACMLFLGGLLVSGRLLGTAINKQGYISALNLIRRYFSDHDPALGTYLVLLSAKEKDLQDRRKSQQEMHVPGQLIFLIYIWISVLFGYMCSVTTWLLSSDLHISLIIGVLSGSLCLSSLLLILRHRMRAINASSLGIQHR